MIEQGITSTQHTSILPSSYPVTPSLSKHHAQYLPLRYAPPSLLAYSSSIFSSYSLFAAFSTSDAVCATPALVSAAAELPLFSPASSMAEATFLVTESLSMAVSLLEGFSELVREGREDMMGGRWAKCLGNRYSKSDNLLWDPRRMSNRFCGVE